MTLEATEIKSYLPCTLCSILIVDIGNSNVEPIAGSYNAIVYKQNKIPGCEWYGCLYAGTIL